MHRRHLVLTFAKGDEEFFEDNGFKVFLKSLEKHVANPSVDYFILTDEMPDSVKESLGDHVVEVNPVDYLFRDRHLAYWKFLERGFYDYVLICDCRDVLFQNNPFGWTEELEQSRSLTGVPRDVYTQHFRDFVMLTTEGFPISQSGFACIENFEFERTVQPKFRNETKDQLVINGGVSFGTPKALKSHHFLIWSLMAKTFGNCTDQAAVNWAYQFLKKDSSYRVSSPHEDFCLTGEGVKEGVVKPIFEDGVIKNPSGGTYSIVHQWDRLSDEIIKDILENYNLL